MFIRLILIGLLVAGLIGFLRWYTNAPKEEASKALWRGVFGLLFLILVGMVLTGRLNWLFALIAAAIPFARKLIPVLRFFPFLSALYKNRQTSNQNRQNEGSEPSTHSMSKQQALEVLGLKEDANRETIIARHRKLMLKAHPDKGGSDWLAAQINEAKAVLLKDPD